MDAGIARGLDIGPLPPRPVLVVPDREERLVVLDQRAAAVAVDASEIADVVAIGFEPAHHRVFRVEEPALRVVIARVERPVVAHLVGASRIDARTAVVEAVAAVAVVGLPGRIGGLEEHVRLMRVVADDEDDVAGAAAGETAICARQLREVDARGRACRGPERRRSPGAAVHEAGRIVCAAGGLGLRLYFGWRARDRPG